VCSSDLRFDMRVMVLADLDIVVNEFDKLGVSEQLNEIRSELLQSVDRLIDEAGELPTMNAGQIRDAQQSRSLRQLWENVRAKRQQFNEEDSTFEELDGAINEFFAVERKSERMAWLKSDDATVVEQRQRLLRSLREQDIFVLDKGEIEDYYPESVSGIDKPTKAQKFCREVTDREQALALCGEVPINETGDTRAEFEAILIRIFAE